VAVELVTTVFNNDVGVRLEDREDFFFRRQFLSGNHPPPGLLVDFLGQSATMPQLTGNARKLEFVALLTDPAGRP
jgi:hypothetical protein